MLGNQYLFQHTYTIIQTILYGPTNHQSLKIIIMKKEEINRAFAEALLRLRRDSISFKKLGIDKQLGLYINNDDKHSSEKSTGKNVTIITFDTETSLWELNHNRIVTKNWKAPLSELIGILNLYETSELLQSIQSLEESTYLDL